LGYSFNISYRAGRHNQATDFISWPPPPIFLAISSPVPNILMELHNYCKSELGQNEIQHFYLPDSKYNFIRGLLYHHHCLILPSTGTFRSKVLHEFHITPIVGTLALRHNGLSCLSFFGHGMYRDTKAYINVSLINKINPLIRNH